MNAELPFERSESGTDPPTLYSVSATNDHCDWRSDVRVIASHAAEGLVRPNW